MQKISLILALASLLLLSAACGSSSATNEQPIKTAKAGDLTVTLAAANGQLRRGDNELKLIFVDAAGNPADVGAASLNFHMAGMGTMAEMNDRATLTTTEKPGHYLARVNLQMSGTWEAQITYQGSYGSGRTNMNVQVK
jgi:hypothetical protein